MMSQDDKGGGREGPKNNDIIYEQVLTPNNVNFVMAYEIFYIFAAMLTDS